MPSGLRGGRAGIAEINTILSIELRDVICLDVGLELVRTYVAR